MSFLGVYTYLFLKWTEIIFSYLYLWNISPHGERHVSDILLTRRTVCVSNNNHVPLPWPYHLSSGCHLSYPLTFCRLAGEILKWPLCQFSHVVRLSRLLHLSSTENGTCNSPEVTSVLTQWWPMTQTKTRENCCLSWEDTHFLKKENYFGTSGYDNLSCSHSVNTLAGFIWLSISSASARNTGINAVFSVGKSCGRNEEFSTL